MTNSNQKFLVKGRWLTKVQMEEVRGLNNREETTEKNANDLAYERIKKQHDLNKKQKESVEKKVEPKKEVVKEEVVEVEVKEEPKVEPKKDNLDEVKKVEELQALCDEKGIKYHHRAGVEKLQYLLNQTENGNDNAS